MFRYYYYVVVGTQKIAMLVSLTRVFELSKVRLECVFTISLFFGLIVRKTLRPRKVFETFPYGYKNSSFLSFIFDEWSSSTYTLIAKILSYLPTQQV